MTVNIPDGLYDAVRRRAEESKEFSSPEAYIEFVLSQVVGRESGYAPSDEQKVKERLEGLGYLE